MKRANRNPIKFDVIDLFAEIGSANGLKINDKENLEYFLNIINNSFKKNMTDSMVFGMRTQELFKVILNSLGKCKLIKKEDSGNVLTTEEILIPDYRVIHTDNKSYLIEVKNFYQGNTMLPYKMNESYYKKLINYSKLMDLPILLAVYWCRLNKWTLNNLDIMKVMGNKRVLNIEDAFMYNKMIIFGDFAIGMKPAISMRLYPNTKKENIVSDESVNFTIEKVEMYNRGNVLRKKIESNIAFQTMFFGDWNVKNVVNKENGKLKYLEYIALPYDDENVKRQGFDIIGYISSIISNHFNWITAPQGIVKRFNLKDREAKLGFNIPKEYKSKTLPLWILYIQPKDYK